MPTPYAPNPPDGQTVQLTISSGDEVIVLDRWTSYDFASNYLQPSDHFTFSLGLDEGGLPDDAKEALRFGAAVTLSIDDNLLASGFIDEIDAQADRNGGHVVTVRGRDRLGQALDTIMDPTFQFKQGSLDEFLKDVFGGLGWSEFDEDPSVARDVRSGLRGDPTTKGGKKKGPQILKSFKLHQTKPYNHESVYHFASRVTQRHGLWIRCSPDGTTLIVAKPDFDQQPIYEIHRRRGDSNVRSGTVSLRMTNQPSIIIADSFSGGGEFGKGRCKAYAVNPVMGYDENGALRPEIAAIIEKNKGALEVAFPHTTFLLQPPAGILPRPMYLHDEESKSPEQIANFVKREMSLLVRQAVTAQYVVEGHGQKVDDSFRAWAVDTIVRVADDAAGLEEDMYVLGVRHTKTRGGSGTTTTLDLILKNAIAF